MPGFKDYIDSDLKVFFNLSEFAETHQVNGRDISIIVDEDRLKERSKKEYDGISVGEILFFVKKEDYGELPEEGSPLIFDGRQMYIFSVREDVNMYEIILSQNLGG